MYQTSIYVDDKFYTIFGQLFSIENDPTFRSLILNEYGPKQQSDKLLDQVKLVNKFNSIYMDYFQIIDSIYLKTNNDLELQLQKEAIPQRVGIDLKQ